MQELNEFFYIFVNLLFCFTFRYNIREMCNRKFGLFVIPSVRRNDNSDNIALSILYVSIHRKKGMNKVKDQIK